MFKKVLLVVGGFFLWGGIDNHLNYSVDINESVEQVQLNEIDKILNGDEPRFVSIAASLAENGQVYKSYLESPRFAVYPPRRVIEASLLELFDSEVVDELLGSTVKVNASLGGAQVELQLIREEGDSSTLQSSSYFAPLEGTAQSISVFSPSFSGSTSDSTTRQNWLLQKSYTGRLARLRDLNKNVEGLTKGIDEILSLFSMKSGQLPPMDALVLMNNRPQMLAGDVSRSEYYSLVKDSDLRLYVHGTKQDIAEMTMTGEIKGVLYPKDSRYYSDFARVLAADKLPKRIGIISSESPSGLNEEHDRVSTIGIVGGLLMIGLSIFLFTRKPNPKARG